MVKAITGDKPLVIATGAAGVGKSMIALTVALVEVAFNEKYRQVLYTRSQDHLGIYVGAIPGGFSEKTDPFIDGIVEDCLMELDGAPSLQTLRQTQKLSTPAIQTMRGRSLNDTIIIYDESQNFDAMTLKSLITRAGRNSKVVVLGSLKQIDAKALRDTKVNGLARLLNALQQSERQDLYEHVHLVKNERSELAQFIDEVME